MAVERDTMEYDVVIVGAGPAGLAAAIRLKQINAATSVCILEKGAEVGSHILSGCVMEPNALDSLLPDWRITPPAICVPAEQDEFLLLTRTKKFRLPTPPQMHNDGNLIISLGSLCVWLAEQAEALGVDVFPGFPAAKALIVNDRVIGIRCADMGIEKNSESGPNHEPGVDIHANVTLLAEGCRGSVSKQLIERFKLDSGHSPQTYGLGFKELWQLPEGRTRPGHIQHTLGWPLDSKTYGGGFIYELDQNRVYIGFVVGLDYANPNFKPFEAFQQFKHHPSIKSLLEGGEIVSSGARSLIEGGWQSLPTLDMPGAILLGDAGGTLNVPKIKGVHQAIRSGMLAAEHWLETGTSKGFDRRFRQSPAGRELRKVRNMRPGFKRGLWAGLGNAALETITAGKLPWTLKNHADWSAMRRLDESHPQQPIDYDRTLPPRDRLSSVNHAATSHDENQPVHLHIPEPNICISRCTEEYGNPCTRFCPASVYEMVEENGKKRLQVNAANCVHCKACDIKDPYRNIEWTVPEGGSGPNYQTL